MSGIAQGLSNIANIALGSTPIVKVSLGDTLIWPDDIGTIDSLTYLNNYGVATRTIDISNGGDLVEGDLIFYAQWLASSNAIADTTPSGWSRLWRTVFTPGNQVVLAGFYCVYDPAVQASTISAPVSNLFYNHGITILRAKNSSGTSVPITSVQVAQGTAQLSGSNPANMSYNQATGLGGKLSAFIGVYCSDTDILTAPVFTGATPLATPYSSYLPTRLYTNNATLANITIGLDAGVGTVAGMQYVAFKVS